MSKRRPSFQEGIEYLKISHKNIEAEKKKVESVLEKERRAMETKTSSNLITAKHHIALSSTISGRNNHLVLSEVFLQVFAVDTLTYNTIFLIQRH